MRCRAIALPLLALFWYTARTITHISMFDKMKELYKLQKQAKQIKAELANIHIEAEEEVNGQKVIVTVNGEMQIVKTHIPAELMQADLAEQVSAAVTSAANKGVKKAQEIAAEKMKGVMGDMQGMMGGAGQQ